MSEYERLVERFVDACVAGRRLEALNLAIRVLDEAPEPLTLGGFYDEILRPAQQLIGERWHNGEANVAQNHATTETARAAAALARSRFERAPGRGERVVLACPDGELHDFGLRLVADVLDVGGYETHLLGASTPTPDLITYSRGVGARAVLLSAATDSGADAVFVAAGEIADELADAAVVVGGEPVETSGVRPAGIFVGRGAAGVCELVARAVGER